MRTLFVPIVLLSATAVFAQDLPRITSAVVIGPTGPGGRIVIAPDAVGAHLVAGTWRAPGAGDSLKLPSGQEREWTPVAVTDGWVRSPSLHGGGYASVTVHSPENRVVMLEARGHALVYINGTQRAGDPYDLGFLSLPVHLAAGDNELLFRGGRGDFRVAFREPAGAVEIHSDPTLPDLYAGHSGEYLGAVVISNNTTEWLRDVRVLAEVPPARGGLVTNIPPIPPLSVYKAPFSFAADAAGDATLRLSITGAEGEQLVQREFPLSLKQGADVRKVTFRSSIDDSVQYYAIRASTSPQEGQALILTLHGASVEATSQASAYQPKDWAAIVAPTNRRPFGFDWEDWGRLDALEVLTHARENLRADPRRIYLTGHSMGGHGTWQIGAHYATRFAAIAPSAGWVSFWSYTGAAEYKGDDVVSDALRRAVSPSDTLALKNNCGDVGVYILHGDADDNVPVTQARQMRSVLGGFHTDFAYYERPGAGHWWGNECVDWPPLMEFLRARHQGEAPRRVRFATASPSISSLAHWVEVKQQIEWFRPSTVEIAVDAEARRYVGTTSNIRHLTLDLALLAPGDPFSVTLDEQELAAIPWPAAAILHLRRESDRWRAAPELPLGEKSYLRGGLFKDAFRNRALLVVGTGGSPQESAELLAKARYDAETFYYRGNGAFQIVLDRDFDPAIDPDRNIVLYGNAETNLAWRALLQDSPVHIAGGQIRIGDVRYEAHDLGCLLIRPRPGSQVASVGVVAGTGAAGFRLAGRVPYFVSGVGIPDWLVITPEAMQAGVPGIQSAGFFENDWTLPESAPAAD